MLYVFGLCRFDCIWFVWVLFGSCLICFIVLFGCVSVGVVECCFHCIGLFRVAVACYVLLVVALVCSCLFALLCFGLVWLLLGLCCFGLFLDVC